MSVGDRWRLPGGQEAIEMPGGTRDVLRLAVIVPGWPYPAPPREWARSLCELMPSQYLQGERPGEGK